MISNDSQNVFKAIQNPSSFKTMTISQGQGKSKIVSRYLQKVPCKVECEFHCNENFTGLHEIFVKLNIILDRSKNPLFSFKLCCCGY